MTDTLFFFFLIDTLTMSFHLKKNRDFPHGKYTPYLKIGPRVPLLTGEAEACPEPEKGRENGDWAREISFL